MLAPDDRAVLREQLRPDPGTTLHSAIATTFTLDLTAALVAPLAFAAHEISRTTDPVSVLEAVRSATGKIDIFCQTGHIHVPAKASDLMAFLEPMVHEVEPPNSGFLFHPKLWIVRYVDEDDKPTFRLLCGTRNLTDDVAWDAVVCLDGRPTSRPLAINRPLADLVRALPDLAREIARDRRQRIEALAAELRTVEWECPEDAKLTFHTLGLGPPRPNNPLATALQGSRQLIVSPFLDDEAINNLIEYTNDASSVTVVSRAEQLDRLDPSTLQWLTCKVISPVAGLAEAQADAGASDGQHRSLLGGLHAKVYAVEWNRQARLFIGSANATSAGLHGGNVEFVVEMQAGPKALGVDRFLGPDAGFAAMLESYETTGNAEELPEETIGRELEKLLRRIASNSLVADASKAGDGWTETVEGTAAIDLPDDVTLRVGLLTQEGVAVLQAGDRIEARFERLGLADITPFVILRVAHADAIERATVVRAELRHDPPGRLDEVIARQVDSPEKFLRFLALLLGLGESTFLVSSNGESANATWVFAGIGQTGVFETLVRALADRPQALGDLDNLIERLTATDRGRAVLPEGFTDVWSIVRAAHLHLKGKR